MFKHGTMLRPVFVVDRNALESFKFWVKLIIGFVPFHFFLTDFKHGRDFSRRPATFDLHLSV